MKCPLCGGPLVKDLDLTGSSAKIIWTCKKIHTGREIALFRRRMQGFPTK
jgi:hypothetical protein